MLYDWYRRYYGVRFQEFEPIKRHLRKVSQVPRVIEIYYFLDGRFFSKFKANQKGSDGSAIIDAMDQKAVALFDGSPSSTSRITIESPRSLRKRLG